MSDMTIDILYFAHFADLAGCAKETARAVPGSTVRDLVAVLAARERRLADLIRYGRVAVNADWATPDALLSDGDEVAFMPPMSGG
jgi:molybdopterin converting factor subunit 1